LYLARIYVTLKPTVNDPQGQTILEGLKYLGFGAVAQRRPSIPVVLRFRDGRDEL
jgi:phosphoribosylformylglycinamidine (FGAM) synthase PurS component